MLKRWLPLIHDITHLAHAQLSPSSGPAPYPTSTARWAAAARTCSRTWQAQGPWSPVPAVEIGGVWPPLGIQVLDPFAIPLLNTILLLSSGAFITYAHHAIIKGTRRSAILGFILTLLFAILFTGLQGYEYSEAGFSIADSVYGTVFFASTGLHGLHVIIGTIFIAIQFIRILNHHITTTHHVGLESAIAYWHFVDVVWLFLYAFVYLWSAPNL